VLRRTVVVSVMCLVRREQQSGWHRLVSTGVE